MAEDEKKPGGWKGTLLTIVAFLGAKGGIAHFLTHTADDAVKAGVHVADDIGRAGVAAASHSSAVAGEAASLTDDAAKAAAHAAGSGAGKSGSWVDDVGSEAYEKASVVANEGRSNTDLENAVRASAQAARGAAKTQQSGRRNEDRDEKK